MGKFQKWHWGVLFLALWSLSISNSFAFTPLPADDDDDDDGGTTLPLGHSNPTPTATPRHYTSASPTPRPSSSTSHGGGSGSIRFGVPCMEGDQVKNADPAKVCKATLPQCSELSAKFNKEILDLLAWKIYGLSAWGVDADLNQSKRPEPGTRVSQASFAGRVTNEPSCNVLGDGKLQLSGLTSGIQDAELFKQKRGLKLSCGTPPKFTSTSRAINLTGHFDLIMDKDHGSLFSSYVRSAYPYAIREAAYQVLMKPATSMRADLSNIKDVLVEMNASAPSVMTAVNAQMDEATAIEDRLSASEKQYCSGSSSDLAAKCKTMSITDPAQKLCKLTQIRTMMNSGAANNLLVAEIMMRAQKEYKARFGTFMADGKMAHFFETCGLVPVGAGILYNKRNRAAAISCLVGRSDPAELENFWCVPCKGHCDARPGQCGKKSWASAQIYTKIGDSEHLYGKYHYKSGAAGLGPEKVKDIFLPPFSAHDTGNFKPMYSVNIGFAGLVEAEIRSMCGQRKITDPNDCDKINIPNIPQGVVE